MAAVSFKLTIVPCMSAPRARAELAFLDAAMDEAPAQTLRGCFPIVLMRISCVRAM
jgi:hypothetical protein